MTRLIRVTLLLALAAIVPATSRAQTTTLTGAAKWADSASRMIDKATLSGSADQYAAARTLLDRALVAFPNDPLLLHYQGYERYREGYSLYGQGKASEVPMMMELARSSLEKSSSIKPMPETNSLLASVLGTLIGTDPSQGMTLGPMIQQEASTAMSTGAGNPRVWLLSGISAFYTPPEYGGGVANAEKQLRQAITLFDADHPVPPAPSWGKAEAYAWLGQVLEKQNKKADAIAAYEKALTIAPDYNWVKFVLLPAAKK